MVGRDGDEQVTAWSGDPPQFGQRAVIVIEVLDHVGGQDEVEALVLVGQLLDRRLDDLSQPAEMAELDRLGREVDALGLAEGPKLDHVAPGATARIQDPR